MPYADPERQREYQRDWYARHRDEHLARTHEANKRRLRMGAGGITFFLGYAPTQEDALRLRKRIREEAPHGRHVA